MWFGVTKGTMDLKCGLGRQHLVQDSGLRVSWFRFEGLGSGLSF